MPESKRKSVSEVTSPTTQVPVDTKTSEREPEQATPSSASTPALPPFGPLLDPATDTKKAKKKCGIFRLLCILLIGVVFLCSKKNAKKHKERSKRQRRHREASSDSYSDSDSPVRKKKKKKYLEREGKRKKKARRYRSSSSSSSGEEWAEKQMPSHKPSGTHRKSPPSDHRSSKKHRHRSSSSDTQEYRHHSHKHRLDHDHHGHRQDHRRDRDRR